MHTLEALEERTLYSATPSAGPSSVTLNYSNGAPATLNGQLDTWIVIHGLMSKARHVAPVKALAVTVDAASSKDQVIMMNWPALARLDVSQATMEVNAQVAADAVAAKIRMSGLPASRINVIGFSMGALVAARLASDLHDRGGVNSIVALDPAAPYYGGTKWTSYNLSADSKYSIAFHGQDANSPLLRAMTADDTVRIDNIGTTDEEKHLGVLNMFNRITAENNTGTNPLSRVFSLGKISTGSVPTWRKDTYDMGGAKVYEAVLTGRFDSAGVFPDSLTFVNTVGVRNAVFRKA